MTDAKAQPERMVQPSNWFALDVDLDPVAEEAVDYALMEAGSLGTETNETAKGNLRITGYFTTTPAREVVRAQLHEALRIYELPSSSVREVSVREVKNRDWLAEWKESWQPVRVGRFVIAPPWAKINDLPDQLIIRIEPGMAFGTGTHETTKLCLTAIEKYFAGGSFLDVGTGTGVLAIAAAKLFPNARIEACDTDAEAIEIAGENAIANEVGDRITFSVGSIDDTTASADVVCANLTADVIAPLLPLLLAATCGRLILSGILDSQVAMLETHLTQHGASLLEIIQDGEWAAMIV